MIFVTHGALTRNLFDPFVRLALIRQATQYDPQRDNRRLAVARHAADLLNDRRFGQQIVTGLLNSAPTTWRRLWLEHRPDDELGDDPVPAALLDALDRIDLNPPRDAIRALPAYRNETFRERLSHARRNLNDSLSGVWKASLRALDVSLPLIILDEAHHVRNDTLVAEQFDNDDAKARGPLGNMFERMLFLTATPFQLHHAELIKVLQRFRVCWQSTEDRARFEAAIDALGRSLDRARANALRFERAWSRIDEADGPAVAGLTSLEPMGDQPGPVRTALAAACEARDAVAATEQLLRPWVIRHRKTDRRRNYLEGRAILDGSKNGGLTIAGSAALPFLLAARAEAVASLGPTRSGVATRGYFAYGLASSFEAYADTRANRAPTLDDPDSADAPTPDDKQSQLIESNGQLDWYLRHIRQALPPDTPEDWAAHPKVAATVHRVLELWRQGEKALVFCFYLETGRALRAHISRALREEITRRAAQALGVARDDAISTVDGIAERLLRTDSRGYEGFRDKVRSYTSGLEDPTTGQVEQIAVRFMRTPSFLTRYVALGHDLTVESLLAAFDRPDGSGRTFAHHLQDFVGVLLQLVDSERDELLHALTNIQTGGIAVDAEHFDAAEQSRHRDVLMPNVRLANGGVRRETRQRLMLTFNTPFFPEILVSSSVMAEGVDLHRDCRHVIHHDLDWNPSTLEQRTGRIDRIGSKASRSGSPVVVYEPYLAGTHDEKMFRVVKDRESWFGVVMGDQGGTDEWATERQAARVSLPAALASSLMLDLALPDPAVSNEDVQGGARDKVSLLTRLRRGFHLGSR